MSSEACFGGEFTPNAVAKRIPKPKSTGCQFTDTENLAQWKAFQKLATYLSEPENSHKIMTVLSYALTDKKKEAEKDGGDKWDDSYHKFGKIPKNWLEAWLQKYTVITRSDCESLTADEPESTRVNGNGKWHKLQWKLANPMHDMSAHLCMDDSKKFLSTFFPDDKGPHTWKLPAKGKTRWGGGGHVRARRGGGEDHRGPAGEGAGARG